MYARGVKANYHEQLHEARGSQPRVTSAVRNCSDAGVSTGEVDMSTCTTSQVDISHQGPSGTSVMLIRIKKQHLRRRGEFFS